jgi:hypothetical protein
MEERVSKVESDIRELKSGVRVIRESQIRVEAMLEAVLPHLATKAEVSDLRAQTAANFGAFRSEIGEGFNAFRSETETRFTAFRSETEARFGEFRAETGASYAALRGEMIAGFASLRTEMISGLADKPSKTYMWGILAVLLTAYACGLAGLAILK